MQKDRSGGEPLSAARTLKRLNHHKRRMEVQGPQRDTPAKYSILVGTKT